MKNDDTGWKCAGALLAVIILPFLFWYSYFANGFVLSRLWQWFVVAKFGLPPLNVAEAVGIAMVVGFLTSRTYKIDKTEKSTSEKITEFFAALAQPWLVMLIGWIVYYYWAMPK